MIDNNTMNLSLLNLLLNTPIDSMPIRNPKMHKYLDSLATYIEKEATDVLNASDLLREKS